MSRKVHIVVRQVPGGGVAMWAFEDIEAAKRVAAIHMLKAPTMIETLDVQPVPATAQPKPAPQVMAQPPSTILDTGANAVAVHSGTLHRCNLDMRAEGKAYPGTCAVCGLGPCKWRAPSSERTTTCGEPLMPDEILPGLSAKTCFMQAKLDGVPLPATCPTCGDGPCKFGIEGRMRRSA